MKKRFLALTLALAMTSALLAGCGDRKQRNTWIIAVGGDFSPFVCADANGKAVALDVELLDAIARDQNFRYELRPSDWDTAMSVFTSHQAQVLMGSIASSQERIDGGWFFSHSFYNGVTQSRTNRGSRSCLAGGDLQLDVASDFLCHNTCTSKFCGELRPAVQTSHGRTTSARPIKTVPRALARSRSLPETRVF